MAVVAANVLGRFVAAAVAEVVYLVGRTYIVSQFQSAGYLEIEGALTAWRLAFVFVYLSLFFDLATSKGGTRQGLPMQPLIIASVLIALATMPLAHGGEPFSWPDHVFEVVAIPIAALREELFYRAIALTALGRVLHPMYALLVTTALFAVSHIGAQPFNLVTLSSFLVVGIVLGTIYQHTRNLRIVVGLHALANFFVWVPFTLPKGATIAVVANVIGALAALAWASHSQPSNRSKNGGMSA